jgi:purine-binding chemotaxis protein CheW
VLGVTSLRGVLLPLLSLRGLLGLPATSDTRLREKVVVTSVAGAQVGLVGRSCGCRRGRRSRSHRSVPAVLAARMGGESRLRGIYRGEEGRRLISILAPEMLSART